MSNFAERLARCWPVQVFCKHIRNDRMEERTSTVLRNFLLWLIRGYQKFISPLFPARCRFYPTCSAYAEQSVQRYGVWRGGWLAARRLAKCHPWHPGGIDPVH